MSNKQKRVQYSAKQSLQPEVAGAAPPRYQPPPQPPAVNSGILKPYAPELAHDVEPVESAPVKRHAFPPSVPDLKLYPLSTRRQYPTGTLTENRPGPQQPGPQRRPRIIDDDLRPLDTDKIGLRLSDEEFLRLPPAEMLKFAKKAEMEGAKLSIERHERMQTLVNELRILKESNRRLGDDNQELRDLCCFLDDDRQKGRKLAREWQRFGRYTASVMRQEVSAYQSKLRELDNKQQELIKDNLELKELCLYLDEERGGACPSCGASGGGGGGLRDDGDGSSSSTNADEPRVPAQFTENTGNPPRHSANRERILNENLLRQRSAYPDQTMQYVRNLEGKIKQLEEEKKILRGELTQTPSGNGEVECGGPWGRPEAVVRALQVLEVREQLEREGRGEGQGESRGMGRGEATVDDNSSADMDDCEKALVREMCNVVWRKLEEGPSDGRR